MNKRGGIGMVEVPYRATDRCCRRRRRDHAGDDQLFAAVVGFARDGKVRRIAIS